RTAICFDGYISSKTNQDCFFINVPTNSSTSVLEINKNLAANFRRYLPSSFNVNAVNFIMKLFFKSGSKNTLVDTGGTAAVKLDILTWGSMGTDSLQETDSCGHWRNFFLSLFVSIRCIFDAICTFTGPSIISADGLTGNITDRCDYHFFSISKPNFIQVDGNYGTRRRTDVSFLDTVVIRLPGSAAYYLEQGGRVKAGDRVLNLTTPKVSGSLKISKNEKGVTAFFQTNTLNASVYFDGYTAQIHLHAALSSLCFSTSSCQNVQTDKADPSLNCPKAKKRCGVLREDPFTRCHAIIAPDSYIKVCEETLCSYPSVDNLPCHYLEAYARACSLMGVPELSGWGQKSNSTTHEALCQDKFCASHEFCGETEANGLGCLCQSAFAAPYRQNKTFGNATTCYRNSASASLINCLLMERGFDYTTLHLKDPKCIGELQDGVLTFSFNNTEMCKTEVMVIYTNTITSSESNDPIIRQDEIALNFSCSYAQPPIKTLSFKIQSSSVVSEIKSGIWQYSLTMKAYSDAGLQQTATLVTLNQKIWVELKTAGLDSNLVAVVIDSCWANKNKESDNSCANPKDKSVKVEGNGEGTSSVFSFNMFQFAKSAADVFLHCKVNLCGKKDKSCAPVCTSKRRRSARNMYLGAPALITMAWTS
uniref:ZP domain-containing protein n=1 Tax=Labrus bergylta TaxID=56723 RepID=A0A3Q3F186_9LABR